MVQMKASIVVLRQSRLAVKVSETKHSFSMPSNSFPEDGIFNLEIRDGYILSTQLIEEQIILALLEKYLSLHLLYECRDLPRIHMDKLSW